MRPSSSLEFARVTRLTRNGEAPLLAAQRRRWALAEGKSMESVRDGRRCYTAPHPLIQLVTTGQRCDAHVPVR
jgi:hypothetical protein